MHFRNVSIEPRRRQKLPKRPNISLKTPMRSKWGKDYCLIDSGPPSWSGEWIELWLNIATLRKVSRKSGYRQTTQMFVKSFKSSCLKNKPTRRSWSQSMRMNKSTTSLRLLMTKNENRCRTCQWRVSTGDRSNARQLTMSRPHLPTSSKWETLGHLRTSWRPRSPSMLTCGTRMSSCRSRERVWRSGRRTFVWSMTRWAAGRLASPSNCKSSCPDCLSLPKIEAWLRFFVRSLPWPAHSS